VIGLLYTLLRLGWKRPWVFVFALLAIPTVFDPTIYDTLFKDPYGVGNDNDNALV
jgi:hypothetical protein